MVGALSAKEFRDGTAKYPRMAEVSLDIARAVLVEGKQIAEVVESTGVDRRTVHFWVKQIYDAAVPSGWVSEVVTLPREMMDRVLRMQEQERAKWRASHAE